MLAAIAYHWRGFDRADIEGLTATEARFYQGAAALFAQRMAEESGNG